ncbi:hypothetical protein VZG28_04830 [Synechococcus elongatus IITB4]|uniref:hypothetical protein n=1 Tax=Synechococcus elongatus TaxID=32046 RepID=UPI0030CF460B
MQRQQIIDNLNQLFAERETDKFHLLCEVEGHRAYVIFPPEEEGYHELAFACIQAAEDHHWKGWIDVAYLSMVKGQEPENLANRICNILEERTGRLYADT